MNDFLYLSNAIDKIHIIDLKAFCYTDNFDRGEELRDYWLSQEREGLDVLLASLGLKLQKIVEDKMQRNSWDDSELGLNFQITYVTSRLGRLLFEHAFE